MSSSEDIARWDEVAASYADAVGGESDSFYRRLAPFLWQQLGDVSGRRVLDLGCGHGWLAGLLNEAGADVVGIDGSTELIAIARAEHPAVRFEVADLTAGLPDGLEKFDAVVAHMVLMDLPQLDRVVADAASVLAGGGVFVCSILHPCFFGQQVTRDADSGAWTRRVTGYLQHEQRWVDTFGGHTHYHRPLSWYVDALARADLAVSALHEPPSLPRHTGAVQQWTEYERWFATIPTMLAIASRPISRMHAG